jgi:competence protein ComEC
VSISGLHITMIAGLAALLVAALWRRSPSLIALAAAQSAGLAAGLATAVGYALLAGWGIPAQRTVLMLAVVAVAWLARTRIGLATALALAAAIVCLIDPWAVLAPGFWLSFGAVAAIAWVVGGRPPRRERPAWQRVLATATHVQLAVTLALVPALIVLFHQLPLMSPLANALAIPVVSWVVTPLALLGGALAIVPSLAWAAQALFAISMDFSVCSRACSKCSHRTPGRRCRLPRRHCRCWRWPSPGSAGCSHPPAGHCGAPAHSHCCRSSCGRQRVQPSRNCG